MSYQKGRKVISINDKEEIVFCHMLELYGEYVVRARLIKTELTEMVEPVYIDLVEKAKKNLAPKNIEKLDKILRQLAGQEVPDGNN